MVAGCTARDVVMYVYGFARGDEARARAILDALRGMAENGSLRGVAGRHGVAESTLRGWVGNVRGGMVVAMQVAWDGGAGGGRRDDGDARDF